jgi:hypothetical protein
MISEDKKQKEKFRILLCREDFINGIDQLRKDFNIPKNGFNEGGLESLEWARLLFENVSTKEEFNYKFRDFLNNIRVSVRWKEIIDYYLLYNVNASDFLLPSVIEVTEDFKKGEHRLIIELYKDTTIEDLKKFYKQVFKKVQPYLGKDLLEKGQIRNGDFDDSLHIPEKDQFRVVSKKKNKRFGEHPNLEESLRVKRLYDEGQTYPEVAKSLNQSGEFTKMAIMKHRLKKTTKQDYLD